VVGLTRVESVPCFAALAPTVRAALAEAFDEVEVHAGKHVTSQGDFAYELFAIVEGTARASRTARSLRPSGRARCSGRSASS
jgi:hypothetical protein